MEQRIQSATRCGSNHCTHGELMDHSVGKSTFVAGSLEIIYHTPTYVLQQQSAKRRGREREGGK